MQNKNYNSSLTFKLYILVTFLFGTYGGRVCPMLETLTPVEVFIHVTITFSMLLIVRHYFLANHKLIKEIRQVKLDSICFTIASIPLALYYNLSYDFPLDSNIKVVFGMALFGFFTGCILQLSAKLAQIDEMKRINQFDFKLTGQRSSLVKQMIGLVLMLLIILTTMLTMIAVKDIFWLEKQPCSYIRWKWEN
ncbi:hypothetical protein ACLKMH_23015 [Psychromonas sp. KJ10-10]|uniref:hypothetical protein n=1 Tax=Psychromonas sp. KJ10-10 TaxID=3391823 RepID=UPI0039B692F1